jgi:hypothetical protein
MANLSPDSNQENKKQGKVVARMLRFFPTSERIGSRFDIVPPAPSPGRSGVAVVAIVRDEAVTVADWISFHRRAGVRRFILYDNGSTDGTARAALNAGQGDVTVVPWRLPARLVQPRATLHQQVLAYAHAICNFGSDVRWMALIDADEYLFPTSADTLEAVLEPLSSFTNVSLPWSMFGVRSGAAGLAVPLWACTLRARVPRGILLNFKCIVDPCDVVRVSVHKFWTATMGPDSVNAAGVRAHYKRRGTPAFLAAEAIRLNHYCPVTEEDVSSKLNKGAVSGTSITGRSKLLRERAAAIVMDTVEDRVAIDFLDRSESSSVAGQ